MTNHIAANLAQLNERIKKACGQAGRNPAGVTLVAVSKQQTADRVKAALDSGLTLFGENRVQEALARWETLRAGYTGIKLHLIGSLQTNKVRDAVALFDVIETLDREKLAQALAEEMKKQARMLPCFIEVNTGGEEQKAGVSVSELPGLLEAGRGAGLTIAGLMGIPPVNDVPALHFALLKKLAARHGLKHLSMGMSADFEQAIALGATHIRVGTALFGDRNS